MEDPKQNTNLWTLGNAYSSKELVDASEELNPGKGQVGMDKILEKMVFWRM